MNLLKPREPRPVHTTGLAIVRDVLELACSAARMLAAGECVAVIAAAAAAPALRTLARGAQCAPKRDRPISVMGGSLGTSGSSV